MIINKEYIDYNNILLKDGYSDLVLKGLNRISLTGYVDIGIKLDLISFNHYLLNISEFNKMYSELYSKIEDLVYTYITAYGDDVYDEESVLEYLLGSEGDYLVDIIPEVKDLVLSYGNNNIESRYVSINSNYENNGFVSLDTLYQRKINLQDELLSYYKSVDIELLTSYNNSIKGAIEILIKYNTLSKQRANNLGVRYNSSFVVKDEFDNPLTGVLIKIKINNNMITLITNSSGYASTKLINGVFDYNIVTTFADTVYGSITVSNSDIVENVIVDTIWILESKYWNDLGAWNNSASWDSNEYIGTITITDNVSVAIEGANVYIDNNILTTNSLGQVSAYLVDGIFDYEVIALGYDTGYGSITIEGASSSSSLTMVDTLWDIEFIVLDEFDNPVENAEINIDA